MQARLMIMLILSQCLAALTSCQSLQSPNGSRSGGGIGSYSGSPDEKFAKAINKKDYKTSAQMVRQGIVTPNTKINTSRNFAGWPVWGYVQVVAKNSGSTNYAGHPTTIEEQQDMVQVFQAILNCDFPEKRSFEKSCIDLSAAQHYNRFLLVAMLDRNTDLSGITFDGLFSGSFSSVNGVYGYSQSGFDGFSDQSKSEIGENVARIEKLGGGSFADFEKGISRRNQWNQTLGAMAVAAPLMLAYGAGKVMVGTGDNIKNFWDASNSRDGGSSDGHASLSTPDSDIQRFMNHFKGQTRSFKVQQDDGGGYASTNNLILEDTISGKRFSVGYTYGLGKSLGVKVGDSVSVKFSSRGEPTSIKNDANGISHQVEDWKASGFGW